MGKYFIFILAATIIMLSACGSSEKYLMSSSGRTGEIIVVCENHFWEDTLGGLFKYHLEQYQVGLPQQEYQFNVGQYNHEDFNKILKNHRNIILTEISTKYDSAYCEYTKDQWALNQIVVKLYAPTQEAMLPLLQRESTKIVRLFKNIEKQRLIDKFKAQHNPNLIATLEKEHGLRLYVQRDFDLAVNKKNFVWLKSDKVRYVSGTAHDVDQGIFIYYYPYKDSNTFTLEYLLSVRDSVCKANVPGPSEGSYMATERDSMYYPVGIPVYLNDNKDYAFEIRGLYKTVNDYYGGPFISLTTYDAARGRIVTIDAYVFAPKFNKREYIREMEAMCYTLEFSK
jgi:hypothetical protein